MEHDLVAQPFQLHRKPSRSAIALGARFRERLAAPAIVERGLSRDIAIFDACSSACSMMEAILCAVIARVRPGVPESCYPRWLWRRV
jgi:hypothetical protein